jgi:hypothetical protein
VLKSKSNITELIVGIGRIIVIVLIGGAILLVLASIEPSGYFGDLLRGIRGFVALLVVAVIYVIVAQDVSELIQSTSKSTKAKDALNIGLVISAAIYFLCFLGIVGVSDLLTKRNQQAALDKYGTAVINLCQNLNPNSVAYADLRSSANAKVLFVDAKNKTISGKYTGLLPADRAASDKTDITGVVCLVEGEDVRDSAAYGSGSLHCTAYQKTLDVYLFDVKSEMLVAHQHFIGSQPNHCPASIHGNRDEYLYGDPPDANLTLQWALSGGD